MTDQPPLPGPPQEPQLPEDDPRTQLVQRVRSALAVLPRQGVDKSAIAMGIELKG